MLGLQALLLRHFTLRNLRAHLSERGHRPPLAGAVDPGASLGLRPLSTASGALALFVLQA
jgi:hypothetical protein